MDGRTLVLVLLGQKWPVRKFKTCLLTGFYDPAFISQMLFFFLINRAISLTCQHLCKFIGTKESVCIRKEFNSHRIRLGHQYGCHFIVMTAVKS